MPQSDALPSPDLLDLRAELPAEERTRLERIEEHLQTVVRPAVIEPWTRDEFVPDLLPGLGALGLGRIFTDGSSALFQGLVHAAIARVDLSLSALVGIHNELIVGTIAHLGSEEQKEEWLPKLEALEAIGAFCLTEPEHGSDIAGGLETTAERTEDGWTIRGSKRWIGAGTLGQIALVWARDTADEQIKCFLVPTDNPGYKATKIEHKTGLKIMQNADIVFEDVKVGEDALLPGATTFAQANDLLLASRAWVGWQGVGAQQAVFDILRSYALEREQFGKPLAGFQIIQQVGITPVAAQVTPQQAGIRTELCAGLLQAAAQPGHPVGTFSGHGSHHSACPGPFSGTFPCFWVSSASGSVQQPGCTWLHVPVQPNQPQFEGRHTGALQRASVQRAFALRRVQCQHRDMVTVTGNQLVVSGDIYLPEVKAPSQQPGFGLLA